MDISVFNRSSKLKWDRTTILLIVFLAISLIYIPVLIWEGEKFGTSYASLVWGGVIILFGLIYLFIIYFPIRSIKIIVFLLYLIIGTMPWHYHLKKIEENIFTDNTYNIHLIFFLVCTVLSLPYLFRVKKKIKIHYRKIFELAGSRVTGVQNGFTGRPYPAGRWNYNMKEIEEFSRFLNKHMIAFPRYHDNKISLSFSAKMIDPRKRDPERSSFISFDRTGNIVVNISKEDYNQYKDKFTFDQLCRSISQVFMDLFEKFRAGKRQEIIQVMEAFEPKWAKRVQIGAFLFLCITFLALLLIYLITK
ncbi:MAG: hypothetical protein JSV24_00140 [Bacteroidales bacterium]|nr:MAG: hypothetical protein JSV24_00140 [Bacteroidales bacterium]